MISICTDTEFIGSFKFCVKNPRLGHLKKSNGNFKPVSAESHVTEDVRVQNLEALNTPTPI